MKIGKEIAIQAKKCTNVKLSVSCFKEMIKESDVSPLCRKFFAEDNWCMENDFPALDILRRFKNKSGDYGIYTDFVGRVPNRSHIALLGNSNASIAFDGFSVTSMIVRHDSKATIYATGNAFIILNLLDSAFVEIETSENAKVSVFQYGTNSNFRITGNVEIKEGKWEK